jgi:hypothetical protein
MSFIQVKTIDGKELWLNLSQVTSLSFTPGEEICLVEMSGGEPHQISTDEFAKLKPFLEKPKSKKFRKSNKNK